MDKDKDKEKPIVLQQHKKGKIVITIFKPDRVDRIDIFYKHVCLNCKKEFSTQWNIVDTDLCNECREQLGRPTMEEVTTFWDNRFNDLSKDLNDNLDKLEKEGYFKKDKSKGSKK